MEKQTQIITWIAWSQILPFILFPWPLSASSAILIALFVLMCAGLGWSLVHHKPWSRKLLIFTQGFNIIVRLITFWANVYSAQALNWPILITYVLSVAASWLILTYIDRPEVQLVFEE